MRIRISINVVRILNNRKEVKTNKMLSLFFTVNNTIKNYSLFKLPYYVYALTHIFCFLSRFNSPVPLMLSQCYFGWDSLIKNNCLCNVVNFKITIKHIKNILANQTNNSAIEWRTWEDQDSPSSQSANSMGTLWPRSAYSKLIARLR